MRLPFLVRIALASDRARGSLENLHHLLLEEVLWAWTPAWRRDSINEILYSRLDRYVPGGWCFEEGLFDCEKVALATPPFPPGGRILLGGAGGGRELLGLCGMGYDVVAFEPSERLYRAARGVATAYPGTSVVRASYKDLVAAAEQKTGPLAPYVLETSFDAVLLGLASINYMFTEADRRGLLKSDPQDRTRRSGAIQLCLPRRGGGANRSSPTSDSPAF